MYVLYVKYITTKLSTKYQIHIQCIYGKYILFCYLIHNTNIKKIDYIYILNMYITYVLL
jgi:hypothetical protein